jgi:hypothetical protein
LWWGFSFLGQVDRANSTAVWDAALSAASVAASSEEVATTASAQSQAARSMRGEPSQTSASKAAFVRGSGRHALAHEIAMNHLENVGRVFERTGTFWENYEPETAAPGHPAEADYVGWSGLSPINILLEDVTGIMVDWPQSRVIWDRRYKTNAFFGVRNYPIGKDGIMDLIGDKETVTITTSLPLTLVIQDEEINLQTAVPVGSTEIAL